MTEKETYMNAISKINKQSIIDENKLSSKRVLRGTVKELSATSLKRFEAISKKMKKAYDLDFAEDIIKTALSLKGEGQEPRTTKFESYPIEEVGSTDIAFYLDMHYCTINRKFIYDDTKAYNWETSRANMLIIYAWIIIKFCEYMQDKYEA